MVAGDIGDDVPFRMQEKAGAVALVGLGHPQSGFAHAYASDVFAFVPADHSAAVDDRWIGPEFREEPAGHAGDGGFAGSPGDRDAAMPRGKPAQHVPARNDRNVQAPGPGDFGIVAFDRGAADQRGGAAADPGPVLWNKMHAPRGQCAEHGQILPLIMKAVGPRNLRPKRQKQLGHGAHADAGRARQMEVLLCCMKRHAAYNRGESPLEQKISNDWNFCLKNFQ